MRHSLEVRVQRRRTARHAVDLPCEVVTEEWPEPVVHRVRELGLGGIFVESALLPDEGSDVLIELRAPRRPQRLTLVGKVRRCDLRRRRHERGPSGFAIELGPLGSEEAAVLRSSLRGLPPPLPRSDVTGLPSEEVWIDALDEEPFDALEIEAALDVAVAGELLTAAVRAFVFD